MDTFENDNLKENTEAKANTISNMTIGEVVHTCRSFTGKCSECRLTVFCLYSRIRTPRDWLL